MTALEHVQVVGVHQATTAEELLDMIDTLRPAWHARAACHGMTDVMFPVGDVGKGRDTASAMLLCARCGVRVECRAYGANEPDGVWGGQYVGVRASRRGPRSSADRQQPAGAHTNRYRLHCQPTYWPR